MKKETYKQKIKQVNHSNQHTSEKTEVVPKDEGVWPYDYIDHKFSRNTMHKKPKP